MGIQARSQSRMNNWILEIEPLVMSKPKRGSEPKESRKPVWKSEPKAQRKPEKLSEPL